MKKILIGILVVVILLLIPFLTKDRSSLIENFKNINPLDLGYTEVSFTNETDNTKLGGMLFIPKGKDSVPLIIFIQGSGYSSRTNSWYLTLTQHLLNNNFAVLLPDKRGSEKSEGDWKGMSVENLATDTEAAILFSKKLPYNFSKTGVIGMSQGGWIAPIVATNKNLDFVINVSGSLTNSNEQLEFEEANNIGYYTYDFLARSIAKHTVKNLKEIPHIKALLNYEPLSYWKNVTIPNLLLYSEDDTNCPVERSLERVKEEQVTHLNIKTYPKGGHAISNEQQTDYRLDFLEDLAAFLGQFK